MTIGDPAFMQRARETFKPLGARRGRPPKPRASIDNRTWTRNPAGPKLGRPSEYSTKRINLMIRVTTGLHERIRLQAAMEGRSMSNLVARILFDALPEVSVRTEHGTE